RHLGGAELSPAANGGHGSVVRRGPRTAGAAPGGGGTRGAVDDRRAAVPARIQRLSLRGRERAMSWLAPYYLVIKAVHIISGGAWLAGLLSLPRLFVYHADAPAGSPLAETFKVMERRLLRGIMNPAIIAAYVFGLALLSIPGIVDWRAGWIYVKLALV